MNSKTHKQSLYISQLPVGEAKREKHVSLFYDKGSWSRAAHRNHWHWYCSSIPTEEHSRCIHNGCSSVKLTWKYLAQIRSNRTMTWNPRNTYYSELYLKYMADLWLTRYFFTLSSISSWEPWSTGVICQISPGQHKPVWGRSAGDRWCRWQVWWGER